MLEFVFMSYELSKKRWLENGEVSCLNLDNGDSCEVFLPERSRDRLSFISDECQFVPVGWARLNQIWYPLGYKIVKNDLSSLGLRRNPNILEYSVGEWICLPDNLVTVGNTHWNGWGGIWSAQRKSSIKTLRDHCQKVHHFETRGYLSAIYRPLYANDYRVKSQGVMLLKEII